MERKQDLVLLHGALGSAAGFNQLAEILSDKFTIHRFDFRGHGNDQRTEAFTIDTLVADLVAFLKNNQLKGVNVFGYSMGGYIALLAASQDPSLFSKIMTLATKFNWNEESAQQESKFLNPDKILEKVPAFAKQLEQVHGEKWKILLQHTAQLMLDLGAHPRLDPDSLSTIKLPVSLHLGDKDKMVSQSETQWAAEHLSNSHLTIIENTPHPWEQVNPEVVAARICSYF